MEINDKLIAAAMMKAASSVSPEQAREQFSQPTDKVSATFAMVKLGEHDLYQQLAVQEQEQQAEGNDAQDALLKEQQQQFLQQLEQRMNRSLQFEYDDEAKQQIVRIVDKETNEVIRQIPAQDLLDLNANLANYAPRSFKQQV